MSFIGASTQTLARGVGAGVAAVGIDYAVLKRTRNVDLFGFEVKEYLADGLLIAAESVAADVAGRYVMPALESKFIDNPKLLNFAAMTTTPLICGLEQAFLKPMVVDGGSDDGKLKEFLLGAGCKLVGDRVVDSFLGYA